jgi:hypothetical protein
MNSRGQLPMHCQRTCLEIHLLHGGYSQVAVVSNTMRVKEVSCQSVLSELVFV